MLNVVMNEPPVLWCYRRTGLSCRVWSKISIEAHIKREDAPTIFTLSQGQKYAINGEDENEKEQKLGTPSEPPS